MTTAGLLLAAGAGGRLGLGLPKAFVPLGGRPLLEHSLESAIASRCVDVVVLVVPPTVDASIEATLDDICARFDIRAVAPGGNTRQESVRRGLEALDRGVDVVICHDAARPLASPALYRRVASSLTDAEGVVPVVPSPDTVKVISGGRVDRTLARDQIGLVQTPQAFVASVLREVHERARGGPIPATDDASLLEAAGYRVAAVEGEPANFKITTIEDLRRAEQLIEAGVEGSQV